MKLTKQQAKKNIRIHWLINLISWITFLVPIITLFYKYTGLSTFEIILISNIFTFLMWFFELPTSVLADTFWRKPSLLASVISNFLCALLILLFPNLWGFCIASVFQALYYSFWSWTAQAFLEENLSALWEGEKFWRYFGKFSFYWEISSLITPLIASLILKLLPDSWYTILAWLDCFFAFIIIILALYLKESFTNRKKISTLKEAVKVNYETWVNAIKNLINDNKLKLFLIYRSFTHHVTFFWILLLPILSDKGMEDWISWAIVTAFTIGSMFASKYTYLWWEKYWYIHSWKWSNICQAIILIIAWLFFNSWIFLVLLYFIFSIFDWIINPSWNHELVQLSKWKSIATIRSLIFWLVALYMTFMKWLLSYLSPDIALIIIWVIILVTNIIFVFINKKGLFKNIKLA